MCLPLQVFRMNLGSFLLTECEMFYYMAMSQSVWNICLDERQLLDYFSFL